MPYLCMSLINRFNTHHSKFRKTLFLFQDIRFSPLDWFCVHSETSRPMNPNILEVV